METTIVFKSAAKLDATNQTSTHQINIIQQRLIETALFNLSLVAFLGLWLRSYPFTDNHFLQFKNLLHGHSHFAFGGWIMPALLGIFLKVFPDVAQKVPYRHWRNIVIIMLVSAYGMLISFPLQGYKAVSIFFSTASIASGYYMALVIWKALKGKESSPAHQFIKWGLIYFAISAIGPFATGPLIAMGKQGTPLYFNAIYFYLHFQYNGFFTFFVLAFVYKVLLEKGVVNKGKTVFALFNFACIPTYALSVLWNQPPVVLNIIGGVGASLQLIALVYFLKDSWFYFKHLRFGQLYLIAFFAFAIKLILQFLSAFPLVASMAYHHRNFVIAYLHLVLLGFISTFFFAQIFSTMRNAKASIKGYALFLFSFVSTELLLTANAFDILIPGYTHLLFCFSVFFPLSILWLLFVWRRNLQSNIAFS